MSPEISRIPRTASMDGLDHSAPLDKQSNSDHDDIPALYVVGPSSSGKTTLCRAIAAQIGLSSPAYITEVARNVMKTTGFNRKTVHELEMQRAIMEAQLRADALARDSVRCGAYPMVLSDRSALDPIVYAGLVSEDGANELINTPAFQAALVDYRKSTFILLKPIPEWLVDDGVRSLDDLESYTMAFEALLARLGISYETLDESCRELEDRVKRATGILKF